VSKGNATSKMVVMLTADELEELVERGVRKALEQRPAADEPRYVDVQALAKRFDVHRTTVITWTKEGCPCVKRGKVVRFEVAAVEAWMRGREPGLRRVK
jgi:hypothetical protein